MLKLGKEKLDITKIFKGSRLSLTYALLFIVLLLANVMFSPAYYSGKVRVGEISKRSIYAPYDFKYPWGVNEEKTQEAISDLKKSLPLVYDIDNSKEELAIKNLISFFDLVTGLREIQDPTRKKELIEEIRSKTSIPLKDNAIIYFANLKDKKENVKNSLIDILGSIYPLGIIDSDTKKDLSKEERPLILRNEKLKTERTRAINEIFTSEEASKVSSEYISRTFADDSKLRNNSLELIALLIFSNLNFNEQETQKIKDEAIKNASPVYDMIEVKKNELIIERGTRITRQQIIQLTQLGAIGGVTHKGPYILGMLFLIVILILTGGGFLYVTEKNIIASPKDISIILINSFIVILMTQLIIHYHLSSYLIPLSSAAMLITLLVGPNPAFLTSLILSIFLGVMLGGKIDVALVLLVSGFVGAYVVREARRRSKIILAGVASGFAGFITIVAIGLLDNIDFATYIFEAVLGFSGGIISIFLVMGLLLLFEYLFKIPTNITLLELSDLNHPLLKELTLRAPGTYQHSVVVGNLAEAACESIGANSLLARVGSYYHDIGKIEKAEYFSENEMGAKSKHEKLAASMSALIIINHVKDGIELAKKYNLNPRVADFIVQHHGTSLIYYFYQRALEKIKDEHLLKEEEFRYPGPRPQTKEAAIVLLADSVEASSRALSDPQPARIRGLVQKIINNKFIDNQLDECDLTLKDLHKIALSFVRVLTAVFHARLEYPEKKNNGTKKTNNKPKPRKSK